jgi:hypothetical protein
MSRAFQSPRPSPFLMWVLGFINRWFLLRGLPLLRHIPLLRDLPGIRGRFWLREIDLPALDHERLRRAVNPGTAAFLSPNHPEFGFDWMMDKELSTMVAPRVASWASHGIINGAPSFWLRNNLVSNTGGAEAMEYSVRWALDGHGVLLHPEGSVHWTADKVHPLFNGVAEMACEAARRAGPGGPPVYIVPIVWRCRYVSDVSGALHEEMERIERQLGLPVATAVNVRERFRCLQENILLRQMRAFGFEPGSVAGLDFFARQDAFRDWLMEDLETRYTVDRCESFDRLLARFKRAIPPQLHSDRAKVAEVERLRGFTRDVYATKPLTQEQLGESLKRHRAALLRGGWRNALHNFLPKPFGPRVAHVRVPEPILVDPARALADGGAYVRVLMAMVHDRMQAALADTPTEARSLAGQSPNFLSTAARMSTSVLPSLASAPTKAASIWHD